MSKQCLIGSNDSILHDEFGCGDDGKQEESTPTKDKKSNLGAQILMVLAASVVGRSIGGRQFLEVSVTRPE